MAARVIKGHDGGDKILYLEPEDIVLTEREEVPWISDVNLIVIHPIAVNFPVWRMDGLTNQPK